MSTQRERVVSAIGNAAATQGIALDPLQRQLMERLADLPIPPKSRARSRGLYIYGPAGRGKSWLTNAYFNAADSRRKTRVHFHSFLRDLHQRVHEHRDEQRALERAIDDVVVGHNELLLFDELHVHDSGDARLLNRMLEHVLARKVSVVATSNYAPDDLLPNPLWHQIFEPGIALIKTHLDQFQLAGATDYRSVNQRHDSGFAAGEWRVRRTDLADTPPTMLAVRARQFPVVSATAECLTATFAQLCEAPLSTIEYLEWTRDYPSWVIADIPQFDLADAEAQQRFINLVDILVDNDVRVHFESTHSLDEFLATTTHRPDAFRMASRMQLLQSGATTNSSAVKTSS